LIRPAALLPNAALPDRLKGEQTMAVTRERFESGMTYQQYKDQMTRNREQFEANERDTPLSAEDLEAFKRLPKPVNVLVLAEDWCGDVIANFPIIGRIAGDSGKLNLRAFLRDTHPDLMDLYLKEGKYKSIPTFVFFDDDFNELGVWIERPDSVTALRGEKTAAIYAGNPKFGSPDGAIAELPDDVRAELTAAIGAMRAEVKPFADREVVRELRTIAEGIAAKSGG
jgi:hypothetical protein